MLRGWFGKDEDNTTEKEPGKQGSRLRLFTPTSFEREKLIEKLAPDLQYFARTFYDKFSEILPEDFQFTPDRKAPPEAQCLKADPNHPSQKLSLEYQHLKGARAHKFGTGRVELRDRLYFAKTVTWQTPKDFLHQRKVYDLIKLYYDESRIMPSKSKSGNGFALKSNKHVVTLEVFGQDQLGFLACDISLNANNQPLAGDRMKHFMEFYGAVYNLLGRDDLLFSVKPKLPQELDVEFIEDYASQQEDPPEDPGN